MSKASRDKGRRGQSAAQLMLQERDWEYDPISSGIKREDIVATDTMGVVWCVEVKNCLDITSAHRKQAMEQAKKRKLPWMLMSKIAGTSFWLVQRQGKSPVIWWEK